MASEWTRVAIGVAAFFFVGCGLPPGQFVIIQNNVPAPGCVVPSNLGAEYRGVGDLDVRLVSQSAKRGYAIFPVVQNNLQPPTSGAADPNRIALSGIDVSLHLPADPDPAMAILFDKLQTSSAIGGVDPMIQFSTIISGSVASGGGNTATGVDAVSGDLARRIRADIPIAPGGFVYLIATLRARGNTTTMSVTSDAFNYPIRVCDGCLIHNVGVCPVQSPPTRLGNDCNIAQDQSIDCCTAGTGFICPPTVDEQ